MRRAGGRVCVWGGKGQEKSLNAGRHALCLTQIPTMGAQSIVHRASHTGQTNDSLGATWPPSS